jgi:uncharacterized protein (TIGR04255 family)
LGVQFKPLESFLTPQMGLLWDRFRKRFPKIEQQPTLAHEIERRGTLAQQQQPTFRFVEATSVLTPRLWMISADGTELLQLQQDRFVRNWRRYHDGRAVYPEYVENLRPRFVDDVKEFLSFLKAENLGDIQFDQCDLTYVNHIEPSGVWTTAEDIHQALRTSLELESETRKHIRVNRVSNRGAATRPALRGGSRRLVRTTATRNHARREGL